MCCILCFIFSSPFFLMRISSRNKHIYKYTLFSILYSLKPCRRNALDRDILSAHMSECSKNCVFRRNFQTNSIIVVIRKILNNDYKL